MDQHATFSALLAGDAPVLALAPMQDVTDLPFLKLMTAYGGADVYYTEYFRVHGTSSLEKYILQSITENPTGRPIIAQMIGNDIPALVRTARELQEHPIVAVDLNLGCPAPIVYRKCAGGGLLREPKRVDAILGALRDAVKIKFTVKTRLGFDSPQVFDELLPIFAKHSIDLLTVHGRTVMEGYRSEVHYDLIAQAVAAMPCPVLANGNISSAHKAAEVLQITNARGLMIGRGAIRNPWLFQQIRQQVLVARASRPCVSVSDQIPTETNGRDARATPSGSKDLFIPTGRDVLDYVRALYEAVCSPAVRESAQVEKMKKYLNFIGLGVEPAEPFLFQIRRVETKTDFFRVCEEFLDHDRALPLEPFVTPMKESGSLVSFAG